MQNRYSEKTTTWARKILERNASNADETVNDQKPIKNTIQKQRNPGTKSKRIKPTKNQIAKKKPTKEKKKKKKPKKNNIQIKKR